MAVNEESLSFGLKKRDGFQTKRLIMRIISRIIKVEVNVGHCLCQLLLFSFLLLACEVENFKMSFP